ncbi:hypothetical protein [Acetobacterium woodii]|nr:hypothetical protein [Acetobacterium woodii]
MNECDKMMSSLGFSKTAIKSYGDAIPFTSRKLDIMKQINLLRVEKASNSDLFALFYILSIAFLVMLVRFITFTQTGDSTMVTIFTSLMIHYLQLLQNSFNAISFLISVTVCIGTGLLIAHLKNENQYG